MPAAVAIFVDRFPVLSQTFVINEAVALAELGHRVSIETRHGPDGPLGVVPDGLTVHQADAEARGERLRALLWLVSRHPVRTAADLIRRFTRPASGRTVPVRRIAVRARRLAESAGELHLHTHFALTVADDAHRIAALLGATTSLTAHAWDIYLREAQNLPPRLARVGFATSGCDYTVAHLREIVGPDAADRIHKQVMGIDPTSFQRSTPLPGTRHVVAIGRLIEKKGFIHLIRAIGRLPDVTVSIAGEGPLRGELEREIERLELRDRVHLLGALEVTEVRALLDGRADLLCMPCVVAPDGDRDSMPVVVKEAMAMELCIAASDEVGLPEVVLAPWGELAPPGDEEALAGAIDRLLQMSPKERARAGAAARAHVIEHADVLAETRKLSGWIEECQSSSSRSATRSDARPSSSSQKRSANRA